MRAPGALQKGRTTAAGRELQRSWWRRRKIQPQRQHAAGGIIIRSASMRMSKQERLKRKQEEDKWKLNMMYGFRSSFGVAISVALQLGQVAAVTTCMLLSLKRLKKQDYVEPQQLHQQARLKGTCRGCDGRGPMALGAHEYIPHYYGYTGSYSPFDGAASYDRIPGRERPFVFAITSRDFLCVDGDGVLRGNHGGLRAAAGGHGDLVRSSLGPCPSRLHVTTSAGIR